MKLVRSLSVLKKFGVNLTILTLVSIPGISGNTGNNSSNDDNSGSSMDFLKLEPKPKLVVFDLGNSSQ